MQQPSAELAWIAVIGGLVALVRLAIDLVNMWRNRRRVEFHVITATQYYQVWNEWDIKHASMPRPGAPPAMKPGDWRRAFVVLEFTLKNNFPADVSVGRFMIDDWLFADRYTGGMYAWKRDYRVFDLFSRDPVSLESYRKLSPKSVYGLRIEILEETSGPSWESSKSRYVLDLPSTYVLKFHRDISTQKVMISVPKATEAPDFGFIHQWGDLLQQPEVHSGGAPIPQG